jgi:DNA-binding response OmpR family regulator
MFSDTPVLIVEDNVFLAVDLSEAVEELDGRVVGPTNRIAQALELLDSEEVSAAIVDGHLHDVDVVMLTCKLTQLGVPFVIQAESELPRIIGFLHPEVPVLHKPILPSAVLTCLLDEMRKNNGSAVNKIMQPKLDFCPKLV